MPKPNKGEGKQDFLKRCTQQLVNQEGKSDDQAYGACNGMWDAARNTRSALSLAAPLNLESPEGGKSKGFLITAYTGALMDLGWYGKLIIDLKGIKAEAKMPVLREHLRTRVVGFSKKAWLQEGNFLISGLFSTKTADGQEVLSLGEEGFPWQASVGIWPLKVKMLGSDKEMAKVNGQEIAGPAEIWTESMVREVSFVSLGADENTAAIVLSRDIDVPVEVEQAIKKQEEEIMPITLAQLEKEAPELLTQIREQARAEGQAAGLEEGSAQERDRVVKILRAGGDQDLTLEAVEQGDAVETALGKLLQAEKVGRVAELDRMQAGAPGSMGSAGGQTDTRDFEIEVKKLAASGLTRAAAICQVARDYPDLHQAYIDRYNPAPQKEG
jgi:hypothetical protein